MQELNTQEIDAVSGGALDTTTAAGLTIGLMALAPLSVPVVAVGLVAIGFYTTAKVMSN